MSTYLSFLFLLLLFLDPNGIALAIPQTSTNSSLAIPEDHCTLRRSLISLVPKYDDCLRAITRLPTRPQYEEGPFHNGPPEDPYQLPMTKIHNTCMVRVELYAGGAVCKASWRGVKGAAWLLNYTCLKTFTRASQRYAGGWTTWGRHERIVISLAYPDDLGEVGGSNVTVV